LRSRNGLALLDHRWDDDMAAIVKTLRAKLDPVSTSPSQSVPRAAPAGVIAASAAGDEAVTPLSRLTARRGRLLAGLIVALGLLATVALLLVNGGDTQRRVRIGALYTLSGDGASSGRESLDGVKLAVDYVNDSSYPDLGLSLHPGGGLPGLGGAKLELEHQDVAGDRCNAQPAFAKLVQKKHVAAVIGAYESTVTLQAIVAANKLRVPLVNDTATAFGLTAPDDNGGAAKLRCGETQEDPTPSDWFARVGGNDDQFARTFERLIKYERDHRGVPLRRVAVLYEGHDTFGTSGLAVTRRLAEREHLQVQPFRYLRTDRRDAARATKLCPSKRLVDDLRAQVKAIKHFGPDIVFALSYLQDATLVVQTMADLRYRPPAMLAYGAGYADARFIAMAREGTTGCGLPAADPAGIITRSSGGWPKDGADANRVAQIFEHRFGQPMTDTVARSFTAAMALATAIDEAASIDPDRIRKALRALTIPASETILQGDGGIAFDNQGQNVEVKGILRQIFGGGYSTVYPSRGWTKRPVWPLRSPFG
jgi:branched-chain amino acid transport system substrate-binding protein